MKRGLKYLFIILSLLVLVSCNNNQTNDTTKKDVIINVSDSIEQGYLDELKISSDGIDGLISDFNYHISLSNDNLKYFDEGYLFANSLGKTKITLLNSDNKELASKEVTIVENTDKSSLPEFNLAREYMQMNESIALRMNNLNDINLYDVFIFDANIIMLNNQNRFVSLGYGTADVFVRLKTNHSCTAYTRISVVEDAPKLFVSKDVMGVGEKAYLDISNLGITKGEQLEDFKWELSNDNFVLNDDYTITAVRPGTTKLVVTSLANEFVSTTYVLKVMDTTNDNINMTIKETYLGSFKKGEQFHVILNEGYTLENVTFGTTNEQVIRYIFDDMFMAIDEGYATMYAYEKENPNNKSVYRIKIEGTADIDYVSRVLNLALGEKGYVERYDEVSGEYVNDTKYNHWYNMEGAWCAMFVSWCWYHSGLSQNLLLKYCSVSVGCEWCKEKGIFKYKEEYHPKSGDIIFFLSAGSSHTGMVVYADDDYVYTIEGNASNRVDVWRWSLKDARITGYGTPAYPTYNGTPEDFTWIVTKKTDDGKYWWNNVPEKQITQ